MANGEPEDERTPLLNSAQDDEDRPLPKLQVALLCAGRAVEGIAFFTIFPFVNEMIASVGGVPDAEVGFWTGLIESTFSLVGTIVMLFWGRASDRFGRRPVMTTCLVGMACTSALFGLAQSVWQMIALRALAGAFGGTVVTIRTMLSENSTPRTQARAFSLFAFAGNLGILTGPIIGGAFSKPATQFPGLFGGIQLFVDFPYLLPCLMSGFITGLVALANILWLKETLPAQSPDDAKTPPPTIKSIVLSPGVRPVLAIFLYSSLLGFLYTALAPVFYFTPVDLGGFGLSPAQISAFIALAGASQAVWILLVFPPLQKRFGTGGVLRACGAAYPFVFALNPLFNVFLRLGDTKLFWWTVPVFTAILSGLSMNFPASQLALNDISPSPRAFGTLNGFALSMGSGIRAFSPAFITSVYAYGVSNQILWGYFGWAVLVVISVGFSITISYLPAKSEGRLPPPTHRQPEGEQQAVSA